MKEFVVYPVRWLLIGLLVLLIAVVGCSSGDKTDVETATETAKETAGETAASVEETADKVVEDAKDLLASLANPEPGIDPVCKMKIDGSLAVEIDGKKYGFCSDGCAEKFKADPAKYLVAASDKE
jgi:YHS domain-containing protein